MKKRDFGTQFISVVSLIFSLPAIVLSIITLCSLNEYSVCLDSTLVSIMGIFVAILSGLVAILITWQIFNYFSLKNEMLRVTDEGIDKIVEDLGRYSKAMSEVDNDIMFVYMERKPCEQIKWHMKALKTALTCEHKNLKNSAIENIMGHLYAPFSEIKQPREKWTIPRGRRDEYMSIAIQIEHNGADDLVDYITNAKELGNDETL